MSPPRVDFSWSISAGNLVSMAATVFLAGVIYTTLQRNDADHDRRIAGLEGAMARDAEAKAQFVDHARRITQIEATASNNATRLNAIDVRNAESGVKFARLEELMTEVRDQLRQINRNPSR